jgi:hypothetical protein
MKNSMSDQMKKIRDDRILQGEFQSLWSMQFITEEEMRKLRFKKRLLMRTKLWLFDWYPVLMILFGGLSIIYYALEILKAFNAFCLCDP